MEWRADGGVWRYSNVVCEVELVMNLRQRTLDTLKAHAPWMCVLGSRVGLPVRQDVILDALCGPAVVAKAFIPL
jgi:hypothetical protein